MQSRDRIVKEVILRAPLPRVWKAITDTREFGQWFGIRLEGDFVAGKPITGKFDKKIDEAMILDYQKSLELPPSEIRQPESDLVFCTVEKVEPQRYFSFRWIPYGIDAAVDPTSEPTTLVEFRLEEVAEGTRLTIVESGFDKVPEYRRERAFRMNDAGWAAQAENVRKYVEEN